MHVAVKRRMAGVAMTARVQDNVNSVMVMAATMIMVVLLLLSEVCYILWQRLQYYRLAMPW